VTASLSASRILVAEDSHTQARRAQLILEEAGFQVTIAADGEAAWKVLRKETIDMVVSDIDMPILNGFELCGRVKGDPALMSVPFVLLTSRMDLEALVRGLEAGADDVINKTWVPSLLVARLTALLRGPRPAGGGPRSRERLLELILSRTIELEDAYREIRIREGQLGATNHELAGERAALREANAGLEAASQLKSQFLANMSHELRTPLNAIIGFSEMLQRKATGALLPKQARYVDNILSSGRHLLVLVNDVLDLAKVEAGRMDLRLELCPVSEVIENAVGVIQGMAAVKHISVEADLPQADLVVMADTARIKQVLLNLLSNAVKFTPAGGAVRVRTQLSTGFLAISVVDNGIGIKLDDQERVFEEFRQLDSSASREFPGTGLGLALSQRLVRQHGGSLTLVSEPGKGSAFTFTLPLAEPGTLAA